MARKEELGTKKISTLLKELAIPAIFAMLVSLLYNMVDRIYIGNMPNGSSGHYNDSGIHNDVWYRWSSFVSH